MPRKKPPVARKPMKVSLVTLMRAVIAKTQTAPVIRPLAAPHLLPGVLPSMAQRQADSHVALDYATNSFQQWMNGFGGCCDLRFPGYPYLAELAQRSEYRSPASTIASEMTRKWIRLEVAGSAGDTQKLLDLTQELQRLQVRALFRKMAELDSQFGRAQLYIKIKGQDSDERRKDPLVLTPQTVRKDSVLALVPIEPMWTTPLFYNATDPLAEDFYKPQSWYVMGKQVHSSRLLTFISREVPDMLKPSYNFGGVSMTQLMEPYVNQWLRTRNSVSDMLHSFSISGVATDLNATLSGDDSDTLVARAELFNSVRDNRGLMLINKDTEEFFQFNVPLSGLDALQAQAQEHMAAPTHIPLVKLLGVTPTGLNASSTGEIQVFYDYVNAEQEHLFRAHLKTVIDLAQLNLWGAIDPKITFSFVPLMEMTLKEQSDARKNDADSDRTYVDGGILDPREVRQRLADDPASGYNNLDVDEVPEPPEPAGGPEGGGFEGGE